MSPLAILWAQVLEWCRVAEALSTIFMAPSCDRSHPVPDVVAIGVPGRQLLQDNYAGSVRRAHR
jgi:hypothetical protein